MSKLSVKKGDMVLVIAGKDKNKRAKVLAVSPATNRVVVEGVNMVTRAQKPNPMAGIQGGLVKKEAPMDSSKVMLFCPACQKSTRIKHEIIDNKKVRVCKKCGEKLDI